MWTFLALQGVLQLHLYERTEKNINLFSYSVPEPHKEACKKFIIKEKFKF